MPYALRAFGAPVWYNNTGATLVLIGNHPVTTLPGSLIIDQSIGRRSTASFIVHGNTATHFAQYQTVLIYDKNTTLLFSGYVSSPQEAQPGFQKSLLTTITCMDQHFLADKRIVSANYANKTCGFIAQDLLATILAQEGVTRGQIYDGLTPSTTLYPSLTLYPGGNVGLVPEAHFAYCTVAAALDALVTEASTSGVPYYWMIDQSKALWFVPYTAVTGPIVDGSLIDQKGTPPTVTRANPTYRNTQYVLGGVAQTVPQDEVRIGDGTTQAWPMGFDLASAPTVSTNLNGAGYVAQSVGLKGTSGSAFYWAQGDPVITQDSAGAKLRGPSAPIDLLQVAYTGQYPSVIISSNGAQIAYEAGIDGTTGIIEQVTTDNTLTTAAGGISEASNLLTRYAQQGVQFVFTTLQTGIAPGQLITVTYPPFGFNATPMLVETVSSSDQTDGFNLWQTVTAIAGPYDVSFASFWGKLLQGVQSDIINVGVTQSTTVLQQFVATITPSATYSALAYSCPLPSLTLFPSLTLYPC